MDINFVMIFFSFLFGLSLGSFMNVCIYRVPLKKSIINPPSSCPRCGAMLRIYDNIPLISYLILLGKCRYCHHPISWRYPFVELFTALLSVTLLVKYSLSYQYIITLLFAANLVTIGFIDLGHKIIPDVLSLPGIVAGWAVSIIPGGVSLLDSLIGTVAGGGSLFLIAFGYERITKREGMGGGDIKLLAMIGAWVGWSPLPLIVLIASFSGAVIGSVFLFLVGKGYRTRIPFGPFLSLGALFHLFFGRAFIYWYYGLFS